MKLNEHPAVTVFTLVLAIIGTTTGTVASIVLLRQQHISLFATAGYTMFQRDNSLQVGLVNTSHRGLAIVGGELIAEGLPVGRVTRVMPAAPNLGDPRPDVEVFSAAQPLPLAVGPGQSMSATFLFDEPLRYDDPATNSDASELHRSLLGVGPDLEWSRATPTLRLRLEPGGERSIRITPPPSVISINDKLEDDWRVQLAIDGEQRVLAIEVKSPQALGAASRPAIGTLHLWRDSGETETYSAQQPVLRIDGARFNLPQEFSRPATYRWAIRADDVTVSVGAYGSPCSPEPDARGTHDDSGRSWYAAEECEPH